MNKIFKLILITFLVLPLSVVNAESGIVKTDALEALNIFMDCMNTGNEEVYNYIDISNKELYDNVENYLHSLNIRYEVKDVEIDNDELYIETIIEAQGIGWNVSGFKVNFVIKKINNEYKITDTDLFNYIGVENVFKFVIKIFAIIGAIFLGMLAIVIIIILIHKDKKKKAQDNFLETQM